MDDSAILIEELTIVDDDFNTKYTEHTHGIFCQVRSVTRSEFYQAGQQGINPAYVLAVFYGDYNGERLIEFRGKRYVIYRTYHRIENDLLELYLEEKAGVSSGD